MLACRLTCVTMLVGNEFLDTAPVLQLQYTEKSCWRERLIDLNPEPEPTQPDLRSVYFACMLPLLVVSTLLQVCASRKPHTCRSTGRGSGAPDAWPPK